MRNNEKRCNLITNIENETVKIWLDALLENKNKMLIDELTIDEIKAEIEEVKGTISNEHLWELGYDGEESINPHSENIMILMEYLEMLEEMLKEKEN